MFIYYTNFEELYTATMSFINAFAKKAEEAFKEGKKNAKIQTLQYLLNDAKNEIYTDGDEKKQVKVDNEFAVTYQLAKDAVERWKNMPAGEDGDKRFEDLNSALGSFIGKINFVQENPNLKEVIINSLTKLNSIFEQTPPNP
jgi:hypothetical protein